MHPLHPPPPLIPLPSKYNVTKTWSNLKLRKIIVVLELIMWQGHLFMFFFIYLFIGFPVYRPARRECARIGTQVPCEVPSIPFPIPQLLKAGHSTRVFDSDSFRIVMWVPLRPTRTNQWKRCETGPTVFRPYPRRLESLTICRCRQKGSTFFSVI